MMPTTEDHSGYFRHVAIPQARAAMWGCACRCIVESSRRGRDGVDAQLSGASPRCLYKEFAEKASFRGAAIKNHLPSRQSLFVCD